MEQYISKSLLVAEIEKMVSNGKLKWYQSQENNDQVSSIAWSEHIATCGKILSFLDTLEVKEGNNLEKEIDEVIHNYKLNNHRHTSICSADIEWIAEHFFELGLLEYGRTAKECDSFGCKEELIAYKY